MDKFQKLYESILDLIYWAEEQGHITEDAATLLIRNIGQEKEEIENQ